MKKLLALVIVLAVTGAASSVEACHRLRHRHRCQVATCCPATTTTTTATTTVEKQVTKGCCEGGKCSAGGCTTKDWHLFPLLPRNR